MNISQFAYRLMTAAFVVLICAATARAYSDEAVKNAEELVGLVTSRFQSGVDANQADVLKAQHYLLEMKYRAGQISRATYCESGIPMLEKVKDLVRERYERGVADFEAMLDSGRELYKLKASCK
jgi:hypothetical protein